MMVARTALLMSLEGTQRAKATQLAERIEADHGVSITPSRVGIMMSGFKVRSVTSSGRSRLVLEPEQLRDVFQRLELEADAIGPEVEEAVKRFGDIVNVVESLDVRLGQVRYLAQRHTEMQGHLDKNRMAINGLYQLERQYEQAKKQVQRATQLQQAIESLDERVKGLPAIEARWKALERSIADHTARVKDLRQREEGLAARQRQLESRTQELGGRERRQAQENAAVDLVELEATIAGKQKELDEEVKTREREIRDLDKQINSKRSLLNRVLGRDGESP